MIAIFVGLAPSGARAQRVLGPRDPRPVLEPFATEGREKEPALELPAVAPARGDEGEMAAGIAVTVREFIIEGSTVFGKDELADATRQYTGRPITSEEFLAARDAVTQLYVEAGYITSGAVVPDQALVDGVLVIQVMEGRISDVVVEGVDWFRPSYFRDRLLRAGRAPVSVDRVERELRLLQLDPLIERVDARLEPGQRRGESVLQVSVVEARPYTASATAANDHSPNVGSYGGEFEAGFANLLGRADRLTARFAVSEGLLDYEVHYDVPLNSYDTYLDVSWRNTETEVIDKEFSSLDIESHAWTASIALRHPIFRSPDVELWFEIEGQRHTSSTSILGQPFAFIGESDHQDTSALRLRQDFTWRSAGTVVALRSTTSVGLDVLSANDAGEPDGQFLSWLLQGQLAHRLPPALLESQVIVRADLQLSSDPLPVLEKLAMGGAETVRGYRHNSLVRDSGVIASAEVRVPVYRNSLGLDVIQVAPFLDVGRGWDEQGGLPSETLVGIGLGLRVFPWEGVEGEIYWGKNLTDSHRIGDRDLQDDGVYFRVTVRPFAALGDLL